MLLRGDVAPSEPRPSGSGAVRSLTVGLARLGLAAVLAAAAIFAPAPLPAAGQPPEHDREQDGRLGGGKGDYICYSRHGFLEVWRYDPVLRRGVLLTRIPLSGPGGVDRLHQQGDRMMVGEGTNLLAVTRWGDQIEVSGLFNGRNPFGPNLHTFRAHDVLGPHTPFSNRREKVRARHEEMRRLLDLTEQHLQSLEMARGYGEALESALQRRDVDGAARILGPLADFVRMLAERAARAAELALEAADLAGDDPTLQGSAEDVQQLARAERDRVMEVLSLLQRQARLNEAIAILRQPGLTSDLHMEAIEQGMEILYGGLRPLPSSGSRE